METKKNKGTNLLMSSLKSIISREDYALKLCMEIILT